MTLLIFPGDDGTEERKGLFCTLPSFRPHTVMTTTRGSSAPSQPEATRYYLQFNSENLSMLPNFHELNCKSYLVSSLFEYDTQNNLEDYKRC